MENSMNKLIVASLLFASITANAAPVYLNCTSVSSDVDSATNKPTTIHSQVTLDEKAHTVTFTDDGLMAAAHVSAITVVAQYSQDAVIYTWNTGAGFAVTYRIDRVNMKFSDSMGSVGSCKLAKSIKRAF
jgi:hypothetical protein